VLPSPTIPADQGHDATTARLLAAGDPDGLRRLLLDHGARVRGALQRAFADALDASSIDEALSQASQRAWRSGARFDPARGSLRAWFYVIALNCARRLLECRRRQTSLAFVDDLDNAGARAPQRPPEPAPRPSFDQLYRCIDALPPQQRAVILADLRADGTARTDDLAHQLGTTPNAIYVARANGRKALRRALEALGHPAAAATTP
jgi:RNA polymerase sigma-70 factor (ECF subfamily)